MKNETDIKISNHINKRLTQATAVALLDPLQLFFTIFSLLHQYSWFIPCCVSKSNLHVYTHIFYIEQRDLSTLATDGNIIKRWISYICWDGLWFLIYRLKGQLSSSCTLYDYYSIKITLDVVFTFSYQILNEHYTKFVHTRKKNSLLWSIENSFTAIWFE